MAKGNEIIVSANPRGVFMEGTLEGALKPGVLVEIKATALDGSGRPTFRAYQPGTDGVRKIPIVLLPDVNQGKLATDAYADGDHCFCYVPVAGEELNMLLQDVSGTGDAHAVGETLIADSGTGKLIATTGTPESEPFQLLEAVAAPTADTLAHCIYTGY